MKKKLKKKEEKKFKFGGSELEKPVRNSSSGIRNKQSVVR